METKVNFYVGQRWSAPSVSGVVYLGDGKVIPASDYPMVVQDVAENAGCVAAIMRHPSGRASQWSHDKAILTCALMAREPEAKKEVPWKVGQRRRGVVRFLGKEPENFRVVSEMQGDGRWAIKTEQGREPYFEESWPNELLEDAPTAILKGDVVSVNAAGELVRAGAPTESPTRLLLCPRCDDRRRAAEMAVEWQWCGRCVARFKVTKPKTLADEMAPIASQQLADSEALKSATTVAVREVVDQSKVNIMPKTWAEELAPIVAKKTADSLRRELLDGRWFISADAALPSPPSSAAPKVQGKVKGFTSPSESPQLCGLTTRSGIPCDLQTGHESGCQVLPKAKARDHRDELAQELTRRHDANKATEPKPTTNVEPYEPLHTSKGMWNVINLRGGR